MTGVPLRPREREGRRLGAPVLSGWVLVLPLIGALAPLASGDEQADGRRRIAQRLPRVVYRGGPFLRRPEITTVTFRGDDPRTVARLEEFGAAVVRSSWWQEVAGDYCAGQDDCIGPGRKGRAIRLPRRLPDRVRDVDLEGWIAREARRGALTGLGSEALVLVYLPAGVVLSDAHHPRYCDGGPRAYHRMLRAKGVSLPYAVIPRCGSEEETTATASHEILEAATNPQPDRAGFRLDPAPAHVAFSLYGGEPADPCGLLTLDTHRARESGFTVQRAWSNRAAAAGTDPCVPSAPEQRPYLALVPRQPVVRLASPGATTSIAVDAVSDRVVPAWTVSVLELTGDEEGERYLEARLDRTEVRSGDAAVLTLRVLRLHPRQMSLVGLVSRLGDVAHVWPIAVSMR